MWKCPRTEREDPEGQGLGETLSLVYRNRFGLCLSLAPISKSLIYLCEATKDQSLNFGSLGLLEGTVTDHWVDRCWTCHMQGAGWNDLLASGGPA